MLTTIGWSFSRKSSRSDLRHQQLQTQEDQLAYHLVQTARISVYNSAVGVVGLVWLSAEVLVKMDEASEDVYVKKHSIFEAFNSPG